MSRPWIAFHLRLLLEQNSTLYDNTVYSSGHFSICGPRQMIKWQSGTALCLERNCMDELVVHGIVIDFQREKEIVHQFLNCLCNSSYSHIQPFLSISFTTQPWWLRCKSENYGLESYSSRENKRAASAHLGISILLKVTYPCQWVLSFGKEVPTSDPLEASQEQQSPLIKSLKCINVTTK